MKKAFIFDLDGTVADTLANLTHYVNRTTAAFGLSSLSKEKIRCYVGNGAKKLFERVLSDVGGMDRFDEIFAYFNTLYNQNPYHALSTFEGMPETLAALKAKGIKLAVLSNKPHFATLPICRHLFDDMMDCVQGQTDGIPVKPDPTGLQFVLKTLQVSPEDCVYVGDSDVDMLTGKQGGMLTVGVSWGFREEEELRQSGADVLIHHPQELLQLL